MQQREMRRMDGMTDSPERAAFERALDEMLTIAPRLKAAEAKRWHALAGKEAARLATARADVLRLWDAHRAAPARETAHATLDRFASLKDNWDSYGALAPTQLAINSAHRLLGATMHEPAVVPTSEGGVQVEWHCNGTEIELRIRPDGSADEWGEFAPASSVAAAPTPGEEPPPSRESIGQCVACGKLLYSFADIHTCHPTGEPQ